ncbi:MAG: acyltransferase family protein [Lachnospiraceae bacterium]|nr:acyltransferase family protein [Lachnospiraceae bacterium]
MNSFFSRKETNIIKGIGILLIFLHHFFTFPGWYINGIAYPSLANIATHFTAPFKIPTAVFAFFTGYFYYFNKKKDYKYSFSKILKIYTVYWIIFIPFYILALLIHTADFNIGNFILQLLALDKETIYFNWYVFFYGFSMLLLPLMARFVYKKNWSLVLFGIILPVIICALDLAIVPNVYIGTAASYFMGFFPCVTIGFFFGKIGLFEKLDSFFRKRKLTVLLIIICLLGIALSMLGRNYIPHIGYNLSIEKWNFDANFSVTMDIIYAPLFIFSMAELIRLIPDKKFFNICTLPFEKMGLYTLEMWLFSSVFFGNAKNLLQPILYFPRKAPLVLIWGLVICFIVSLGIRFLSDLIGGKKFGKKKLG